MKTKTYTSTEIRKNFSEAYNSVRYTGEPVVITNHGDNPVVLLRMEDVYPEPTSLELHKVVSGSGAFSNKEVSYE